MTTERWRKIEQLFHAAAEREHDARSPFLAEACAGDSALQAEVESLLAADAKPISYLDTPAFEPWLAAAEREGHHADALVGARIGAWTVTERIASGGMGTVYRAERADGAFAQTVAIKVIRAGADRDPWLERFQRERELLSRLDHPNITRLLDGGTTDDGAPYLVMEHVDGAPIDVDCDRRRLSVDERLALFREVCAAVQYAHQRLVVHRDLKPANVLVDANGAPKLCDFGIAKVLGPERTTSARGLTLSGVQPMTLAYASPEQVRGEPVTTASDVYSLGVLLYELLCGERPYRAASALAHEVEAAICTQDPERPSTAVGRDERTAALRSTAPERLRRRLRGDLDNVVLMAMRKEPERRYASAAELALDIERHQAGEPVRARKDTWSYRTSKFLRRHAAASALVALALVLLVGAGIAAWRSARIAKERLAEILRLADLSRLADETRAADELWPALPSNVAALESWQQRAREIASRLESHRAALRELRARGGRDSVQASDGTPAARFASVEEQWQHDKQAELVDKLEAFVAPGTGTIDAVARRLDFARTVTRRTIEDHASAWQEAVTALEDRALAPRYDALALAPQVGLVPLGRDPRSGLFEFAHLQTGTVPARASDGALAIDGGTAIVFVLLPGGTFSMGARPPAHGEDGSLANVDPAGRPDEAPVHAVTLAPFLLAKHEMTQGQWLRFTGENPSAYSDTEKHGDHVVDLRHPVEQVSWDECALVLARLGLALPTEAQWEYAARAGTSTPWSEGRDRDALIGAVNLCDQAAARAGMPCPAHKTWPELDDGHVVHAPVGSFRASPFGLHDMHGNVWEWCRDGYVNYARAPRAGDGLRELPEDGRRVGRGGAFTLGPESARSSHRAPGERGTRDNVIGVRPMRAIDP